MLPWLHLSAVHFATALLLSGLLFDALGLFKKLERLLFVGFWNTLLGAAGLVAAVLTGYVVEMTLGPHDDLGGAWLRFHKFLSLVATMCAVLMAGARIVMKGSILPRTRTLYLAVGFFGAALLIGSGILGSALVRSYGLGIDRDTAQRVIQLAPEVPPARATSKASEK
jgi:uncharacterized membrane protein